MAAGPPDPAVAAGDGAGGISGAAGLAVVDGAAEAGGAGTNP